MSGPDGSAITLPGAPTYAGYTFNGWFAAASGGTALTSPYTLVGTVTLYAQWTVLRTSTLTLTLTSTSGTYGAPPSRSPRAGARALVRSPTR